MTKAAVGRIVGTLQLCCVSGVASTDNESSWPWEARRHFSKEVTWITKG